MKRRIGYDCTSVYYPDDPPSPVNPEPNPQPGPAESKRDTIPTVKGQFKERSAQENDEETNEVNDTECEPRRPRGGDGRPRASSSCSDDYLRSVAAKPEPKNLC